jgi:hypothetical protein
MSLHTLPALIVDVGRRRTDRRIAAVTICAAGLAPWLIDGVTVPAALLCAVAAAALACLSFWRAGWISGLHRLEQLVWLSDGRWLLADRGGVSTEADMTGDSRVAASAVWLSWRTEAGRSRSMPLRAGDVPPVVLRALIVRLRVQGLRKLDVALLA